MRVTFVSNYINHHQLPVSDAFYERLGDDYTFIQTEPMEEERINMGWDAGAANRPYVKLFYEEKELCEKLILESDCVIFGGCEDESIIRPRLLTKKFTLRYSERLYKDGRWKFVSPRGLRKKYNDHTRFKKQDVYMLCAGAYVKGDFSLVRAYTGKMLKYGYFPKTEKYEDINKLRENNQKTEIFWAARFISWKHPEMMLSLAQRLKRENINAHITMVGTGELFEKTVSDCKSAGLTDYISFESGKTPDEVRLMMRKADIFVLTSDRKEGWGAVVNEAMNSGCVTIASKSVGATPYLIRHGENGLTYKAKSDEDLYRQVVKAINDKKGAREIGKRAYETITNLWNSEVAVSRLLEFIESKGATFDKYKTGPLSKA